MKFKNYKKPVIAIILIVIGVALMSVHYFFEIKYLNYISIPFLFVAGIVYGMIVGDFAIKRKKEKITPIKRANLHQKLIVLEKMQEEKKLQDLNNWIKDNEIVIEYEDPIKYFFFS